MGARRSSGLTIDRLKSLVEINSVINSNYEDVNGLFASILKFGIRLVACDSAVLMLARRDEPALYCAAALGDGGVKMMDFPVPINASISGSVFMSKKSVIINNVRKSRAFYKAVADETGFTPRTMASVPLMVDAECVGVVELFNKTSEEGFNEDDLAGLELMSSQAAIAYKNADAFRKTRGENSLLHSTLTSGDGYHTLIWKSRAMKDLLSMAGQVAKTASSALILGESGVGKELLAEQIHLQSSRAGKPFVRVNCAALPSQLLESELFGHVKGAFTDAVSERKGRFEAADGGTLFLDEVGDIPLEVQSKLLRALQSRSFEKVGSNKTITVDARIIAATNRDLEAMVREGTFRQDLFYRLNVLPLWVPPLRQRKDDIVPLADFFCRKFSYETKKIYTGFSEDALEALCDYQWPGNIRELENCVERACVLGTPPRIFSPDLRLHSPLREPVFAAAPRRDRSLKTAVNSFKKQYITQILNETAWNKTETGKVLDIQRTYLPRLMKELGITR